MIEFIPLEYYYPLFINGALIIILFTLVHTWLLDINDKKNIVFITIMGYIMLIFSIVYIGLRPVSGKYFVDMETYAQFYNHYISGGELFLGSDIFFHKFMKYSASILPINIFFLLCAFVYIYPMYRVSKAFFEEYWYYSFLLLIVSFSFWSYGVNGIRNGMATSLFLLGLSFKNNNVLKILFFVLAVQFHQTLLLPIGAYIMALLVNKPKLFLIGWSLAIPLSIALGSFWESLFASLGFADDRLSGYLTAESEQGSRGFRYDFLIYSAFAVFVGWYFIFKKQFEDKTYTILFNVYLITNAFWILVIRANFSNRFAYLSWFLMALIIIYPFLKERFFKNQHVVIGRVVLFYFSFTYLMYYVYYGK